MPPRAVRDIVGLLSYANGVHLNIPYSYSVLKGLTRFINILNNIRIPVTSAGDMRRVITHTRHHTPKTKLRFRKNSTPRTMYRYKGNT